MNTINQDSIRDRIKALGFSQNELAKLAGVPQPSISKFLSGKTITVSTLEKLWPFLIENQPQTDRD